MLKKVKLALRISHNYLDEVSAIKTYCLFVYSSDNTRVEGYRASWEYQLECLRKTSGYMKERGSDV